MFRDLPTLMAKHMFVTNYRSLNDALHLSDYALVLQEAMKSLYLITMHVETIAQDVHTYLRIIPNGGIMLHKVNTNSNP